MLGRCGKRKLFRVIYREERRVAKRNNFRGPVARRLRDLPRAHRYSSYRSALKGQQ